MGRRSIVVSARGLWLRDPGSRLTRCDVVLLGKALYLHVHPLYPGVKWVPGRTVKAYVFEQFHCTEMVAGLHAPRGVEWALE